MEQAAITFRLQNARAGEPYSQKLLPQPADAPAVVFCEIMIPEELELIGNKNTGVITGTPQTPGEQEIAVIYRFADDPPSPSLIRRASVKLTVTPNPRSMWLNLPSDRQAVYWKEDEECGMIQGSKFCMLAASKRGRSHAHVGGFRDDDYRMEYLEASDWYVTVVSDGAGSATYSRRGAQIICTEAIGHLQNTLNGPQGKEIDQATDNFHQARSNGIDEQQLEKLRLELKNRLFVTVGHAAHHAVKAIKADCDSHPELKTVIKDYASTALIAACKRYAFGTLCVAYWVGDGAVAMYSKNKGVTLMGDVDSGEYSGQTRFLDNAVVTQDEIFKRIRFELADDITALILMSDGVSDPKFETEARLARAGEWDQLWLDLENSIGLTAEGNGKEQRLLSWLDFWSPGNHDDRTIAIIY